MENFFRKVRLSVSVSSLLSLLIGLGLTAALFATVRRVETTTRNLAFQQAAQLRVLTVSEGLSDAVEQLTTLNQLFRTMGNISRTQFREFTTPILARYPEIQALSYQRKLLHPQRAAYEAAAQASHPGFTITEFVDGQRRVAAVRPDYNVVHYIEPVRGNEAAIGLDTAATATSADARARSRRSGEVAASGLLSLVQYPKVHDGILVVAPVYRGGALLDTEARRQRAVTGETAAVFRASHLIQTLLAARRFLDTPRMSLTVYAAAKAQAGQLAFSNGPAIAPPGKQWLPAWLLHDRAPPSTHHFTVAGNPWTIEIAQAPASFADIHNGSLYALLGGSLSSALLAAYIYSLVSRSSTIERVTAERTSAISSDNAALAEKLALRIRTEKSLRLREKVIEVSSNAIVICSPDGPDYVVEYVNPAFSRITGYTAAEVIGKPLTSLQGGGKDQQNIAEISAALRERREGHAVLRNYRKDGSDYWNDLYVAPVRDDEGNISNFVVAQYDISAVMRFEAELEYQAHHDALTGLANRNLLQQRLGSALSAARHDGTDVWVAFADLDRFKYVNDTLGHEAGDALLRQLGERLRHIIGAQDTVARMGGDEFMLVLPGPRKPGAALALLHAVMAAVAEPMCIDAHEFFLTCSVGIAIFPGDGSTAEELTKHADIAMYRAKELGRANLQFYTAAMNQPTLDRLQIEAELRHALEREQLVLHYQPQIALASGAIIGMEVLLRWEHPVMGMIAPARFIGLAEEMGLIIPIGAWVLRAACLQARTWEACGMRPLRMAVNLSARQFTQKGLVQTVANVLDESGIDPRCLELELTESMVMSDVESTISTLGNLKHLGVKIAIDDFGTGYSSLSYLRRFPIDVLKIDQSFVRDIALEQDDAAIVGTIISLAHSLRLEVIAEGVETAEQLAFLRNHGCDEAQGYFFSRPVGALELADIIAGDGPSERMAHAHVEG